MEEINYCVEILNLFENEKYSNSHILKEIATRNYKELVIRLDEIKLEDNNILDKNIYGSSYTGYFDIRWYQKKYEKYIDLLQKNISEGEEDRRYGYSFLDYVHRLQQLFINKKLDEKQMLEVVLTIDRNISRKHLFISLLEYMKKLGKWDDMEYYIEQMPVYKASSYKKKDEPTSAYGYQIRIYEYINNVDLSKFKIYYKKCVPAVHKYEMKGIKADFIFNYSKQKGVKPAMELTKKAPFKNYEITALNPQVEILSYSEMLTLIKKYEDVLNKQKSAIKERLLVDTLKAEFNKGNYNESYFLEVYKMIQKMDRKERWGDFKLKDALFFDLAESTKNLELIINCRKEIKHNLLKKELKYWETESKKPPLKTVALDFRLAP
jgi:hypothetical protein